MGKTFEEKYFKGYFKGAVGGFTPKDLRISRNWFWAWLEKLNKYIPIKSGEEKSILEIGCSIGGVASLLSDRGFKVYASDISHLAIENAKKLSPDTHFFIWDVQKPCPIKKQFDIIISFEVIEHLQYPQKALTNFYSCLKKGGAIVISTPYPYPWTYNDPTHINVKFPNEWVLLMQKEKFKNVKYHRFSLLPFFYRFSKYLQIIIPFAIPLPYINNPIYFIGKK